MLKKLCLVILFTLALPVAASMVGSRHQAQAFNFSVAIAGHTQSGGYACACSTPDNPCLPDSADEVIPECGGWAAPDGGGTGLLLVIVALGLVVRFAMRR